MRFFSDNAAAACPEALAALDEANRLDTAYDGDAWSRRLNAAFSALFEREVEALWVSTGTAANGLALAALCPPHGRILCHRHAHIEVDECGAPEFYTGGAKLMLGEGEGAKLTPEAVDGAALDASATTSTSRRRRRSRSPTPPNMAASTRPRRRRRSARCAASAAFGFHVDGARFANAVASLGASPADLTWRAGVDALSFGFTKNGGLSAEALILFDPALAETVHYRRKRAGHLLSKGRYLAAQLLAMLEGDVWLRNARAANDAAGAAGRRRRAPIAWSIRSRRTRCSSSRARPRPRRSARRASISTIGGRARRGCVTAWDSDPAHVDALAAAIRAL